MSNPGVVKLIRRKIGRNEIWLDDNLGESVHIHIGDFRFDLSVVEFEKFCDAIRYSINNLVNVDRFDIRKINPVFFEHVLGSDLLYLEKIELDRVYLADLIAPEKKSFVPLAKSRYVRAIRTGKYIENSSNFYGQTTKERIDSILQSIKDNGYPYQDQYIILYNDEMIIRDGQHRAACLYTIRGNIQIDVLRLRFSKYENCHTYMNRWKYFWDRVKKREYKKKNLFRLFDIRTSEESKIKELLRNK